MATSVLLAGKQNNDRGGILSMKKIISISDLNNNFVEVEKSVESGEPVYLTKMAVILWFCLA